ncbi:MAG: tetratricopeptide repeat protein [Clostridiales bacterium]|jgi:tetratricopeptide (TPR) repeat protein|nr:tetratricopeptide repeat protein [Clostridiales bacterium]
MAVNSPNKKKRGRVIPFERNGEFFLRLGSQRMEKNDLVEAISLYHRALRAEPENVEIQLAIAEVLTEMHRYEQSNRLLFSLLSGKDSPTECFFGIACNFLGLQEFSHAYESLENYLALDPEGDFADDAMDMMEVIEDRDVLYSMPGIQSPDEHEAVNVCAKGRRLLELGRAKEAIKLIKDAAEKWPDMLFVHNNLALAYFCDRDYEGAMRAVRDVLLEDSRNVQAHCNLLLFMHAARDEEGVERELVFLKAADSRDMQDWNRMAVVFLEMEQTAEALSVLKKLQAAYPYDEGTLHRLAMCRYLQGRYELARDCYDRLLKIDPNDTVAAYYRRVCHNAADGKKESVDWLCHYEVPYAEILRRVRYINEKSRLPADDLKKLWSGDARFRALLNWSLHLPDASAKRALITMIAGFNDKEAELMLRRFQMDQMQPDAIKHDVFALLKRMRAPEPYIAYLGGRLVQSKVQLRRLSKDNLPISYRRVLEAVVQSMQNGRGGDTMIEAADIFQKYLNALREPPRLKEQQIYAMAAALEYLACRNRGEDATKTQLADRYGVTLLRLKNAINNILRALEE